VFGVPPSGGSRVFRLGAMLTPRKHVLSFAWNMSTRRGHGTRQQVGLDYRCCPSELISDAPVHPDRGTPHPSAIMLLAESEKCPDFGELSRAGVWGQSPQEHRKIRRRHTQFETEISKASPKFRT